MKILFICKRNETYGFKTMTRRSSGLYNSTKFIVQGLRHRGYDAKIVEVIDNNCIDREVSKFKPDIVVIEALWVVPEKFEILQQLHPSVKWFVHLHSDMPFLALEGIAMQWIVQYTKMKNYLGENVKIIANSEESFDALSVILEKSDLIYLPNVYISKPMKKQLRNKKHAIDIGCFGAVRPLKNHLLQAMAAIKFAKEQNKKLKFHINATRVETMGDPVLKNLRQLFKDTPNTELVETAWHEPGDFIDILHRQIDIGMQVSLTETFNVVSADYVTAGCPIVVSKEVKWASWFSKAKDNSINSIVKHMRTAYKNQCLVKRNQNLLLEHSCRSQHMWACFVDQLKYQIETRYFKYD